MSRRGHHIVLAVAAAGIGLGIALWARWGGAVWVADIIAWCS